MCAKFKNILLGSATIALATGLIGLTGCSEGPFGSDMAANSSNGSSSSYAYSQAVDGSPTFLGSNSDEADATKVANQYYFPFDDSKLSDQAKSEVRKHARYLLEHPNVKVRVEGHTDERGPREYNVALGERRAKSVSSVLTSEGALKDQVAVVSYGEEKPSVRGSDESAYKWNRRARIVYERG